MTNPSHRYRALGELSEQELEQMLGESETLFVEHKRSLGPGDSNYQLAKAVASFANGLGGWVLIGGDPDVLSAKLGFRGPDRQPWTHLGDLVDRVLLPPLQLAVKELEAAEFYGRFICHAWMIRLAYVVWVRETTATQSKPEQPHPPPRSAVS